MIAVRLNTGTVKADSREDPPVRWENHSCVTVPITRILYCTSATGPTFATGETLDPPYSIVGIEGRGDVAVREPLAALEYAFGLLENGVWLWDLQIQKWLRVTPA